MSKSGLPIDEVLPALRDGAARSRNAGRLQAPPGAGKSTVVPLALLDEPWLRGGKIIDARAAPARGARGRAAHGGDAGRARRRDRRLSHAPRYARERAHAHRGRHRGRAHAHAAERPGARRRGRRDLRRVPRAQPAGGLWASRFALDAQENLAPRAAAARDVGDARRRGGRRSCSATRRVDRRAAGRVFPVEDALRRARALPVAAGVQPGRAATTRPSSRCCARSSARCAKRRATCSCSCRARARSAACRACSSDARQPGVDVLPLYGELAPGEQDAALAPARAGRRKIVLATNIAETSLTIDGVRIVVDAGLERRSLFDPASGMNRLETQRISRASAEQRAGRAGRTAPGVCYRLWSEGARTQPRGVHAAGDRASPISRRSRSISRRGARRGRRTCAGSIRRPRRRSRARAICCAGSARSMPRAASPRTAARCRSSPRIRGSRTCCCGARARRARARRGARRAAVGSRSAARGGGRDATATSARGSKRCGAARGVDRGALRARAALRSARSSSSWQVGAGARARRIVDARRAAGARLSRSHRRGAARGARRALPARERPRRPVRRRGVDRARRSSSSPSTSTIASARRASDSRRRCRAARCSRRFADQHRARRRTAWDENTRER